MNLTSPQQADLRKRIRIILTPDVSYEKACNLADDIADMVMGWMKMNLDIEKSNNDQIKI